MNHRAAVAAIATLTLSGLALASPDCPTYVPGHETLRNRVLAEPQLPGANRVQSITRGDGGKLWYAGPRYAPRANAKYGAHPLYHRDVIFARQQHLIVAIDPWCDTRADNLLGYEDYELARNIWLRENGYVQSVRTHINPARYQEWSDAEPDADDLPTPRATIERHIEKREPETPVASYIGAVSTHEVREALAEAEETDEPVAKAE